MPQYAATSVVRMYFLIVHHEVVLLVHDGIDARHKTRRTSVVVMTEYYNYVHRTSCWFSLTTILCCCQDHVLIKLDHESVLLSGPRIDSARSHWPQTAPNRRRRHATERRRSCASRSPKLRHWRMICIITYKFNDFCYLLIDTKRKSNQDRLVHGVCVRVAKNNVRDIRFDCCNAYGWLYLQSAVHCFDYCLNVATAIIAFVKSCVFNIELQQ